MIDEVLHQEALQLANSEEGMKQLVHALLFSTSGLEADFIKALKEYVYLKRVYQIQRARESEGYNPNRKNLNIDTSKEEIENAHERMRKYEIELGCEYGFDYVAHLKKSWGKILSFRYWWEKLAWSFADS